MCASFVKRRTGRTKLERLLAALSKTGFTEAEAICAITAWITRSDAKAREMIEHARRAHSRAIGYRNNAYFEGGI
jgi:hypothetical protein